MAYEMLTGRVPYTAATPLAVLLAHMHKPLPLPREINPGLSLGVEEVLLKGLAKAPGDRYPGCSAFLAALGDASRTPPPASAAPLSTTVPAQQGAVGKTIATASPDSSAVASKSDASRRLRPAPIAAALAVLAVLVGGGLLLVRGAQAPTAAPPSLPEATLPPVAGPQVVFQDNFDNSSLGGLPRGPGPGREAVVGGSDREYVDGEYVMRVAPGQGWLVLADVPGSYADATISVDVRIVGQVFRDRSVSISCRSDGPRFYRMAYSPENRSIDMWRTDGEDVRPEMLVSGRTSPAIRPGDQMNRLEMGCVGSTISALVNGVEVASVEDSTFSEGRIWLAAWTREDLGIGVSTRWDNLVVTKG